ncbi:MAG: glycosyl transferase [Armatimonadota bacterium]|nr:MAG: glycosyl transferase [Armatimonadota bacterium]
MSTQQQQRIAFYMPSLAGGGAQRVFLHLAQGFAEQGYEVHLVLARAQGPYLPQVPSCVRMIDLRASRVLTSLPGLVRYLRDQRPCALLSALDHANVVAICARWLARVPSRVIVTVHSTPSQVVANARALRAKLLPLWARFFYRWADTVVAVSQGVADELVHYVGIPAEKVKVIYNPIVTPELFRKAEEPLEHPWFREGEPPVVLGVGRLTKPKDFPTLIRAFALVRRQRPARLMILGEGEERSQLEALAKELGIAGDVSLPGFVQNPYPYMKKAAVFVLSSRWEGLPTVLVEALALGTPVVSTDCPSGSAEILDNGRLGTLTEVGDHVSLAQAIGESLDAPRNLRTRQDYERFTLEHALQQYERLANLT